MTTCDDEPTHLSHLTVSSGAVPHYNTQVHELSLNSPVITITCILVLFCFPRLDLLPLNFEVQLLFSPVKVGNINVSTNIQCNCYIKNKNNNKKHYHVTLPSWTAGSIHLEYGKQQYEHMHLLILSLYKQRKTKPWASLLFYVEAAYRRCFGLNLEMSEVYWLSTWKCAAGWPWSKLFAKPFYDHHQHKLKTKIKIMN